MQDRLCYCDSGKALSACCLPFIQGKQVPVNPEQLMRSRFTAFVLGDGDYLYHTHHPSTQGRLTAESLAQSARETEWAKLVVKSSGMKSENVGFVEFIAYARQVDKLLPHYEISHFIKENAQWFYLKGVFPESTVAPIKLARNELCLCGSGKKFKRCCLAS